MTCAGSWDAPQVTGEDVDPTGLTFTVTYTGGATKDVTSDVTVSPAKWGDTPGSQTATFSYTEGGLTKTTTKAATVVARVADPVISCTENTVTMSCDTDSATIHYTMDGTTPTAESAAYSEGIAITEDTTFKAIAVKDGMADSAVVTEECEYVAPVAPSEEPSDNPE